MFGRGALHKIRVSERAYGDLSRNPVSVMKSFLMIGTPGADGAKPSVATGWTWTGLMTRFIDMSSGKLDGTSVDFGEVFFPVIPLFPIAAIIPPV